MNPHKEMANWRKSRASSQNTSCVEVGGADGMAGIRDTKQAGLADSERDALVVDRAAFASFISGIKSGKFSA